MTPPSSSADVQIVCMDCRLPFLLSASEQRWYAAKGWVLPVRCRRCREARRAGYRLVSRPGEAAWVALCGCGCGCGDRARLALPAAVVDALTSEQLAEQLAAELTRWSDGPPVLR